MCTCCATPCLSYLLLRQPVAVAVAAATVLLMAAAPAMLTAKPVAVAPTVSLTPGSPRCVWPRIRSLHPPSFRPSPPFVHCAPLVLDPSWSVARRVLPPAQVPVAVLVLVQAVAPAHLARPWWW